MADTHESAGKLANHWSWPWWHLLAYAGSLRLDCVRDRPHRLCALSRTAPGASGPKRGTQAAMGLCAMMAWAGTRTTVKKAKLSATWADYCAKTGGLPYCRTSSSLERSAILRLSRFTDLHGLRRKNEQFLGAAQCLTVKRASASVAPGTRCGTLSSLRAAPPAHAACTSTPLRRQAARPTAAQRSRSGCMPFREPPRGP
jgi:hypothetical protein